MKLRYPLTLALLLGACASAVAGPIAAGKQRVLGSAYSPRQAQGFTNYWNADVSENAGKWGSVEAVRGQMNWGPLDEAYQLAKRNHMQFQFHVGLWGASSRHGYATCRQTSSLLRSSTGLRRLRSATPTST